MTTQIPDLRSIHNLDPTANLRVGWHQTSRQGVTSNVRLRNSTCSTLLPMVGCVEIASPRCSLYRVVVFPALSSPTCQEQSCSVTSARTLRTSTSGGNMTGQPQNSRWALCQVLTITSLYSVFGNQYSHTAEKICPIAAKSSLQTQLHVRGTGSPPTASSQRKAVAGHETSETGRQKCDLTSCYLLTDALPANTAAAQHRVARTAVKPAGPLPEQFGKLIALYGSSAADSKGPGRKLAHWRKRYRRSPRQLTGLVRPEPEEAGFRLGASGSSEPALRYRFTSLTRTVEGLRRPSSSFSQANTYMLRFAYQC